MSRLIPLAALIALSGCIIVIKDGGHGQGGSSDGYGGDPGEYVDSGWTEPEPEQLWWLSPDSIVAGQTSILSLQAEPVVDYSSIANVEFYGDVTVCAISARDGELLVTASAAADAIEGPADMLIELADGTAIWVDEALWVTGEQSDASGEPSGDPSGGDGGDGCGA